MPRSLLPREHGAYAQLAAPLVAALAAYGATAASVLLAAGACLAFVTNEPLLVMLGHRGKRAQREDGPRARRLVAILSVGAGVAGIAGLALAPRDALAAAAFVAVPAALLVGFAVRREERSLPGEIVAAIALTGAAAPVAVAGGASLRGALLLWSMWAVGFVYVVVAVHRVIARHKRAASAIDRVVAAVSAVTIVAAIAASYYVEHAVIALPLVASATVLVLAPPSASRLRAIGFALVAAACVSLALTILV